MDPLTHARRRLALLASAHTEILDFFDSDILGAVKKREAAYVARMTEIFTNQFKNKYSHLIAELSSAEKRMETMDKQMDLLRNQCDRRRLEMNKQRRAFLLEIIGLKQTKDGSQSEEKIHNLLKRLEDGDLLHADSEVSAHDDEDQIILHVHENKKKIAQQNTRIKALDHDLRTSAASVRKVQGERDKLKKKLEESEALNQNANLRIEELTLKVEQLKSANQYANRKMDELLKRDGPAWWERGTESATKNRQLLDAALDELRRMSSDDTARFELEAHCFDAITEHLGGDKLWSFYAPLLSRRSKEALGLRQDEREPIDEKIISFLKQIENMHVLTSAHERNVKVVNELKEDIAALNVTADNQDEVITTLQANNKQLEAKLKVFRAEKDAERTKKKRTRHEGVQVDLGRLELEALKTEVNTLKRHGMILEKQAEVHKQEHAHEEGQLHGLEKQIKFLMSELQIRRDELKEAAEEALLFQETIKDLQDEKVNLSHRCAHLEDELNRLRVELHGHGRSTPASTVGDEHVTKQQQEKVDALEKKLKISQQRKSFFEHKSERLQKDCRALERQVEVLQEELKEKSRAPSPGVAEQEEDPGERQETMTVDIKMPEKSERVPLASNGVDGGTRKETGPWGWLVATLQDMVKSKRPSMPMKMPALYEWYKGKSVDKVVGNVDDRSLWSNNHEDIDECPVVQGPEHASGHSLEQESVSLKVTFGDPAMAQEIELTPDVLAQAVAARKWLVSQQARMNWAVLARKLMNMSHRFRVENLTDTLTQYQAEKELNIYERLLLDGKRRVARLERHRSEVQNNRQRATEQVLSAAFMMAMTPRRHVPRQRAFPFRVAAVQSPRATLHTSTIDLGHLPSTQQEATQHFKTNIVVPQTTTYPHSSMGYFPARNVHIDKRYVVGICEDTQAREDSAKGRPRKKCKRKKRPKKHPGNPVGAWFDLEETEAEGRPEQSGNIVRNVLRIHDAETAPTFSNDIVHKDYSQMNVGPLKGTTPHPKRYGKHLFGHPPQALEEMDPTDLRTVLAQPNRPDRPASARTNRSIARRANHIVKGPMFRQMSGHPQPTRMQTETTFSMGIKTTTVL